MISSRSFLSVRTGLVLVLGTSLAGCAGDAAPPPSPVASASAPRVHWLDGDYQGQRTPEVGNPDCGFETAVGYDVHAGSISLRTRKQRRALVGVIDAFGHFSMTSADGQSQVVGSLDGGTLTAVETQPPHHHRHSGNEPVQGGVCTAQIEARRVADVPVQNGP